MSNMDIDEDYSEKFSKNCQKLIKIHHNKILTDFVLDNILSVY